MGVSCGREHRLQGSMESENHQISRLKSEEVNSASWEATFVDFCDPHETALWDTFGTPVCFLTRKVHPKCSKSDPKLANLTTKVVPKS